MSAQANYFKLGIFVVIGTALLVGGVIILGAGKLLERKIYVETYMPQSVEGLTVGADVKFKGVSIGTVKHIAFANHKYEPDYIDQGLMRGMVLVKLALDAKYYPGVSDDQFAEWLEKADEEGLRVRVSSSGIAGPAFIEAIYLDPKEFPAPKVSWTPPPLYVPSAPSRAQVVIQAVERIAMGLESVNYKELATDIVSLISELNTKAKQLDVTSLRDEAMKMIEDVRAKVGDVDAKGISDEVTSLLEEVRASNQRLQDILNDPDIDPSIADLRATLQNAKDATARLDEILNDQRVDDIISQVDQAADDLPPAMEDVRRVVRRIDRLIATQQGVIESILAELERAIRNVDIITEDASDNPSRLLFGEPPPRDTPGGNK